MGTGITGLSHTIAQLDDAIVYFRNVDNKHDRRFFDVVMALLIMRNSKERDYSYRLEWRTATFVCLETVTSCLYAHAHLLKC